MAITVSFKGTYEAIPGILDRLAISYRDLGEQGFEVDFPDNVKIFNDANAESQPSEWYYQVDEQNTFIYPLNTTEELTWRGTMAPEMKQALDMLR